jgi:hypothetical protein
VLAKTRTKHVGNLPLHNAKKEAKTFANLTNFNKFFPLVGWLTIIKNNQKIGHLVDLFC